MIIDSEKHSELLNYVKLIDEAEQTMPTQVFYSDTKRGVYKRCSGKSGRFVDRDTDDTAFDTIHSKNLKLYFSEDVFKDEELVEKIKKIAAK